MLVNGYEFQKIKSKHLPNSWQEEGVLLDLESFLQDNWEQRKIFYSDQYVTGRQQFIDFDKKDGIKLQNYIGTIIFRGDQLNIFPKVFKEDEDDYDTEGLKLNELISNLVYWLEYCDKLNFPFVSMKSELYESDSLLELFITIYVHYVKNALDKQRFYMYEDVVETGSYVKGKIDFNDYYLRKYPTGNRGMLNYSYSSFEFDNVVNQIIKTTSRFLLSITNQKASKEILQYILMKLSDVRDVSCVPYDCDKIHLSKMHSNYRIIISMSKMFLLNRLSSNDLGNSDSFCFLFPAEIIFEGFIGGFLKQAFKGQAVVKTQASDQYLAELVVDGEIVSDAFLLKEDIVVQKDDNIVVLDTKYKEIDRFSKVKENKKLQISDSDMKQMAIYAARRGAKKLYLLYPLHRFEDPESISIRYDIHLDEATKTVPLEILKVPFAFRNTREETENQLKEMLYHIL